VMKMIRTFITSTKADTFTSLIGYRHASAIYCKSTWPSSDVRSVVRKSMEAKMVPKFFVFIKKQCMGLGSRLQRSSYTVGTPSQLKLIQRKKDR
jgi:hypothetical protein